MILALKTAQFLSKNGLETGPNLFCNIILWRSVVDMVDRIDQGFLRQNMSNESEFSAFSESSNDYKDTDVVYSQYKPYRIVMS